MREALQHRMLRFARKPPISEETDSMFEHLATTLIQEGHLCPLPISVQPIYWEYDHALRMYSPPHTVRLHLGQRAFAPLFVCLCVNGLCAPGRSSF
jgi:DNA polymerase epsilon subunit 2